MTCDNRSEYNESTMASGKKRLCWPLAAGLGAVLGVWAASRHQQERSRARSRLRENSLLIDTARGVVETARRGAGPTVLVLHGAAGGYDMGLALRPHSRSFQTLSISRPGYLRTPLSAGRTAGEQADLTAALLDALELDQVAVMGASAGGPSAIEFALRYPQRCWALVLV